MKTRTVILSLAALAIASVAAISFTSASVLKPTYTDADFVKMCTAEGTGQNSCACQVQVMHETLSHDEISWAAWLNTNKKTAFAALMVTALRDPAKMAPMADRLSKAADLVDQRCKA